MLLMFEKSLQDSLEWHLHSTCLYTLIHIPDIFTTRQILKGNRILDYIIKDYLILKQVEDAINAQ